MSRDPLFARDWSRDWSTGDVDDRGRAQLRECEWDGCGEEADYRAPKSPQNIHSYRWFCLDHVREYNGSWNYFADLEEDEIEAIIKRDSVWHRPSWPLGAKAAASGKPLHQMHRQDPYNLFTEETANPRPAPPPGPRDKYLAVLGLDRTAGAEDIKARYKNLAKMHHPDANGGSKEAEERIKEINQAYTYLKNSGDGYAP